MQRKPEVWLGPMVKDFVDCLIRFNTLNIHMYPHKTATSDVVIVNTTPTHCIPRGASIGSSSGACCATSGAPAASPLAELIKAKAILPGNCHHRNPGAQSSHA